MTVITLANGQKFDVAAKRTVEKEAPLVDDSTPELPNPAPRTAVKLEDMPAAPRIMNAVAAVIAYRLLGLPDNDIAKALGCTSYQLSALVNDEAYAESYKHVLEAFHRGQKSSAVEIIQQSSLDAAKRLAKIATTSKNEANALRAIDSILDRTGITAEEANRMPGQGLMIKVVRGDTGDSIDIKVGG
jgi:hypothetical protein